MTFFQQYFLPIHLPQEGIKSPQAVRTPYDFVFDEQEAIERVKKRKLSEFVPVFVKDPLKSQQVLARWEEFFNGLEHCRQRSSTSYSKAKACLRDLFKDPQADKVLSGFLKYPHWDKVEDMLITTLGGQLSKGMIAERELEKNLLMIRIRSTEDDDPETHPLTGVATLSETKKILANRLELFDISPDLRKALLPELSSYLEPNLTYSNENDIQLDNIRAQQSERKKILYQRGELLVKRGKKVDYLDYLRVKACLDKKRPDLLWVGTAAFLPFFFLTLIFVLASQRMNSTNQSHAQSYLLMFFVLLSILLLAKVLYLFTNLRGFAIPVGAGGLIVALLTNPLTGLLAALLTAIYTTFLTTLDIGLFIYYLIGSVSLVLFAARSNKKIPLFFYAIIVGGLNVLMLVCIILLRDEQPAEAELISLSLQAFFSAPGAWLVTVLFIPLGEKLFRLATADRLRELADLNHPLLKKLQEKAPGTYYHSLAVANLASAAAEAVKADVLLVRAGAYYHDIGKIMQPEYYIENQNNRENPHDSLDPTVSYEIVKTHVEDGVSIAHEYRLPLEVINLIAEHHGTTLIEVFFTKAVNNQPDLRWNRDFFRYSGPKPGRLESGILMIADVVEAVGRVLKTTNILEVRERVHKIIVSKFEDRQFDRCVLTTSTLAQIEAAMTQVLLGILHKRIEYPEQKAPKREPQKPAP